MFWRCECAMLKIKNSLTKSAVTEIKSIHEKSRLLNSSGKIKHAEVLLELMREHIREVGELVRGHNPHFLVETGDLAVLCLELMLESGVSPDEMLDKCYQRYHKKLDFLLKSQKSGNKHQDKQEK